MVKTRIRQLRDRHGWNQAVLTEKLGWSPNWASRYERGERGQIALHMMRDLARVLGVCPGALYDPSECPTDRLPPELLAAINDLNDEDLKTLTALAVALKARHTA